jgi:hypothetical protein
MRVVEKFTRQGNESLYEVTGEDSIVVPRRPQVSDERRQGRIPDERSRRRHCG